MTEKKEIIKSAEGGLRQVLGERWDYIPGGWQSLREVAAIAHYGNQKNLSNGAVETPDSPNWQRMDNDSEMNVYNHGLAHAFKAQMMPPGSAERIRQLAKAAWGMLAAIWIEKNRPAAVEIATADDSLQVLNGEAEARKAEEVGSLRKLFGKVAG